MAEARAAVTLTTNYAVESLVVNPDLLYKIRSTKIDPREPFYDVLVGKKGMAPTHLAYKLGDALRTKAAAEAGAPVLRAERLALVEKHVKDGTIDIKKSVAGTMRAALGRDLGKAQRTMIDDWIKARYDGGRLTLTAEEVLELRALVDKAVTEHTSDPARDSAIDAIRADIAAVEHVVRARFRAEEAKTTKPGRKALWGALAGIAEADGVFVTRTLASYTIEHEDGSQSQLDPALARSQHFLNPGGFKAGGGRYDDATVDDVLAGVYGTDPENAEKAAAAKKFLHTLNKNEGGPGSMNTWDSEIVTAGPGLAGSGRLQGSLFKFKEADPDGYFDALGKFGIDIVKKGKGNAHFTVRVPTEESAIPAEMRALVTPGEVIIGSTKTGAKKSSPDYKECPALRYISKDPILLSRFMYAGEHAYQRFLIEAGVGSMQKAEGFTFTVAGQRFTWESVAEPLGADWLGATQAVIAYRYHASPTIFEALQGKVASFYASAFGTDREPASLTDEERKRIARFVTGQIKTSKYSAYRKEFPTVADELFPE